MQHITILDFVLLPVYLFILYIIIKKQAIKYQPEGLHRYFITGFWLHMVGSVLYSLVVQYYYGYGDAFTFYVGGNFIVDQVLSNSSNISLFFTPPAELQKIYSDQEGPVGGVNGYIGIASAVAIMKFSALTAVLTFNKFLITSLLFGFFSYMGQWKLFLVFNDINKAKHQKLLAWAVLYTPSIWFWGSGLIKESICMGALGFIIFHLYNIFIKKKVGIKKIIALMLMVYLVWLIKSYIIIILAIGIGMFMFVNFISRIKIFIFKAFVILVFLFASITIAYVLNFNEQLEILAQESKAQVDTFQRNYEFVQTEESRGGIAGTEIDATPTGLILHSPVAIFNGIFRPFLWESRSAFILLSALESTILLIITIYLIIKLKVLGFIKLLFNNPYIFSSFIIAMLFALIIGFTTFNLGTLARYRIVLLPFYFFMLISMYTILTDKKNNL